MAGRSAVDSPDALITSARELAGLHAPSDQPPGPIPAHRHIAAIPDWLHETSRELADEPKMAKAAEWLLDNRHVVDQVSRQIAEDMPAGYYSKLMSLADDQRTRTPRIYDVARHIVSATNLQLNADSVTRFVEAYQEVDDLELAELWALPTMLRLSCLETLVASLLRLATGYRPPFTVADINEAPVELDDTERIARAVRSLTTLNEISWPEFVEATSAIDAALQDDPAAAFAAMDEQTRDGYRRAVEELARGSHHEEHDVARRAVALARGAVEGRARHVGFWLVAEGRPRLEQAIRYRPDRRGRTRRRVRRHATAVYLGAFVFLTGLFMLVPAGYVLRNGAPVTSEILALMLLLLPATMPAVAVLHWAISLLIPPRPLPKLDFDGGIPDGYTTAVAIPCLLTATDDVVYLLARIERHWLSNPDPNLRLVLLTDFGEADTAHEPQDHILLSQMTDGIADLNRRHGSTRPFHVLHRERRYNPLERRWMGWERKRGKLEEFNRLLQGDEETGFHAHEGDADGLANVRFVLTLDADTLLAPGTAARLVGTLAHPLNHAEFDPVSGRVTAGYTIVQPRVEISPESGATTLFTRLFCGDTAIDIYSRTVSNVYQDLFDVGIYVGKAIYDVAAFSRSLAGRVPENTVASHDLLEGIHGRVALATDIAVYEDYPPTYFAFVRRLHRWIRGDWQLLPWFGRQVPGSDVARFRNRFKVIDRWKMVDNLRRSLLPLALLLLFVSGWTWLPGNPLVWTVVAALAPVHHLFIDIATGVVRERTRVSRDRPLRRSNQFGHWFLYLTFLPHQAWIAADAISRTLVRVLVTKRHLLQWTTSAQAAAATGRRLTAGAAWREMSAGPIAALSIGVLVGWLNLVSLLVAVPLLALWAVSPQIALRISNPSPVTTEDLDVGDETWLRTVARRTWFFFETFVGPDRHWLPPDNFQEDPDGVVAERTSPTNIGMLLVSTLAAYDLGYIGMEQVTFRLRYTLRTVDQLDKYRGHLLNWYDIRTLAPLEPRYVSTVDSGNLAAALLAVQSGLNELIDTPVLPAARWRGLVDTITVFQDQARPLVADDAEHTVMIEELSRSMVQQALDATDDPSTWARTAHALEKPCGQIEGVLIGTVAAHRDTVDLEALHDLQSWLARIHNQIQDMQQEIALLAPWLGVLDGGPTTPVGDDALRYLDDVRETITDRLRPTIPLRLVGKRCEEALVLVSDVRSKWSADRRTGEAALILNGWLDDLEDALAAGAANARRLERDLADLAADAERQALGMDFGLLYDPKVRHFFLGYNLTADQMDPHHYDLLASEARLASFVAIAKGDVPVTHWFSLNRPLTTIGGTPTLLSWGGTMFEYLMPPLLLRSHPKTLLGVSQRAAVDEQMADGRRRGIPWGVSESGFAAVDADHNYQYRAFGVQGLGRKRGLDDDRVVAPYASALALPLLPRSATQNLRRLQELGMLGRYGFYEAVDFTPDRLPEGRYQAVVRSYMAHHQGMVLAALDNALCADALVRRFDAHPRVQAVDLLLQERIPDEFPIETPRHTPAPLERPTFEVTVDLHPWRPDPLGDQPSVHLLGNGRLATRVTGGGAGGLSWGRHAVTRASPDGTLDNAGLWIYVRDRESGGIWSVGRQPTGRVQTPVDVVFHGHMVELHRRNDGIAIRTDIAVAPGDDIEVRRITVVNETDRPRSLTFTSYGEVVLAPAREDARHPAFSKLFVEATLVPSLDALVYSRRARSPDEQFPALLHRLVTDSPSVSRSGFETDRERFLGRVGSIRSPRGVEDGLSGRRTETLDPIMALSAEVDLAPFATEQFAFVTIVGGSRTTVTETAARHDSLAAFEWLIADAHAAAAREAGRLGLEADNLPEFQRLLSSTLAAAARPPADAEQAVSNRLGQPGLWGLGISGDDPVLLVETSGNGDSRVVQDVFRAHQFWYRRGVAVDVVVLSNAVSGYQDETSDQVHRFLADIRATHLLGRRGGIHLVRADRMTAGQRQLLNLVAGVTIDGDGPRLGRQLTPERVETLPLPPLPPTRELVPSPAVGALVRPHRLLFDNGLGGFSPDGREYVIHLEPGQTTPAPWCNILANDGFGTLVTESGGGYTWARNCGEYRLTPWTNDPVLDTQGESLYLRDEEIVDVWSPTPGPARSKTPYQIRHGAGYTEWRNTTHGIESRVRVFVPTDEPVKIVELRVRNHYRRDRRLTATYYTQWLLGRNFELGPSPVVTTFDAATGSLRASNHWNPDFADTVAFLTTDREPHGFTTDRAEFFGPEGDPGSPAALQRVGLAGRTGTGFDPCGCLQVHLEIAAGDEVWTHFVLGAGADEEHATRLARRWRDSVVVDEAWQQLTTHWDSILSAVTVDTPEPALDLLVNRWALYQVLSSRVLGRTGFYQSSGAFGFRDQLQDVLAVLHVQPDRTRAHILESAGRQFEEGDVLHWWHPPFGRGVRTRCSDDLLWLPFVTARYVEATGDAGILDEDVPFLSAPPLGTDEPERYDLFRHGETIAPLFEHCRRALERGLTRGSHGLPLMGDGDWNDGMNRVGSKGRGESVWLGWFAGTTAEAFASLCECRGEADSAVVWRQRAREVFAAVEEAGWDGAWYRRAFDDNGEPWGSVTSDECQIDSIAQSWAALSNGASPDRTWKALQSARSRLVRNDDQLACLLWPPFDLTSRNPGYIKAYPPGIRENGGQYSHAAAWLGLAFAHTGDGDQAGRILRMLNPVERAQNPETVRRYRTEPYVIAADIAGVEPFTGRGGWSWYTGAAGWTWRLAVEGILGLRLLGDKLRIDPRLPSHWPGFRATIRTTGGFLDVRVTNDTTVDHRQDTEIRVDGNLVAGTEIDLPDDGGTHSVEVLLGVDRPIPPGTKRS